MSATFRAELRKLRYTRSLLAVPLAGLIVSVAAATVLMAWIESSAISDRLSDHGPLRFGATNLGLVVFVFGARLFADETHHHTYTSTLLAQPRRSRVLLAKSVIAAGASLALTLAVWALVLPVTAAGVAGRDLTMVVDVSATLALLGRAAAAMVLIALLAVAVAVAIGNRTVALVAGIVWIALVEDIAGAVLRNPELLPADAVDRLVAGTSPIAAAAVLAGWTALAHLVAVVSLRRDVA